MTSPFCNGFQIGGDTLVNSTFVHPITSKGSLDGGFTIHQDLHLLVDGLPCPENP